LTVEYIGKVRYMHFVRELVGIARALGDPTRVRLVAALRNGELCVCELVDALAISQSSLSSHLQICRQTGVVTTRKEGRWIYYSLSTRYGPLIERIFSELQTVGSDEQLRRDARRLKKRLQMREGGRCVVGFGQLKPERELADVVD
jgi:ArsR family transcriptional regulator, arsenate/arsenite/antimonite-responsive transcriptional repressor